MVVLDDQNISNLQKITNKISINNFISILFHHGIKAEDIIVVPKLLTAASGSTILDVYFSNNKFCIEINIFKIGNFSILEDKYLEYIDNDKPNSLQALLTGIKVLSSRYILDNERLLNFTEKSFHISTYRPTIDIIINNLYQELREDYNVTINYEQTLYNKLAKPSFVGRSYLNHIYLGGVLTTKMYLINIRVIISSATESEKKIISDIKERIKPLVKKSKSLKAIIEITSSNSEKSQKKYNDYIGNYVLKSRIGDS